MLKRLTRLLGINDKIDVVDVFQNDEYVRINARRLEHLASLNLPMQGRSVLELGAGIGDHTSFFVDRGCKITVTEARDKCLEALRRRFPDLEILAVDMDNPPAEFSPEFDVIYAYGLLYHLSRPAEALAWMAQHTSGQLLLETCVSFGSDLALNLIEEDKLNPTQATTGTGCRPTRPWISDHLSRHFKYVYFSASQPSHEQFPTDWNKFEGQLLSRAIFVASHVPIENSRLVTELPMLQFQG